MKTKCIFIRKLKTQNYKNKYLVKTNKKKIKFFEFFDKMG